MGKRVGKYLQQLREAQGQSMRQLGTQVGISPSHLCLVETGQREVSITLLFPIIKALDGDFVNALKLLVLDAGVPAEAIAGKEIHSKADESNP
ncbi:MAG: helix-turn-helix transcriptional regulator [Anaerolineae bacterium]|nr:helix-turn-helix transcriptional regulator [Anaerolineae bacterium]